MRMEIRAVISRRDLLRFGPLTSVGAAVLLYLHADQALAVNTCNPADCPIPNFSESRSACRTTR